MVSIVPNRWSIMGALGWPELKCAFGNGIGSGVGGAGVFSMRLGMLRTA
jgi:hypothetical protein